MFSDAPANDSQTGAEIDPDRHCYPHSEAMNGAELATMATRLERFARIGLPVDQAEKLADRLKDRDREADDRHLCLECSSLTGGMGNWRCMAFRQRGARDPGLPADYTGMLTRCSSFNAGEPVADVYASVRALPPRPAPKPVEQQYHPLTPQQQVAARDYHKHHFACARCISAGQGRGERCQRGAELWSAYTAGDGDAR